MADLTARFGFDKTSETRWPFTDRDLLDGLLAALENHDHSAGSVAGALEDPTEAPTATVSATGGTLAAGDDYYYVVTFLDEAGLETTRSDELHVEMPAIVTVEDLSPTPTGATGGTLPPATYYYALTALSAAGESALSQQSVITTESGQGTINLALPALPEGATAFNVWRMALTDAGWTKVGDAVTGATIADAGVPKEDCPTDPDTQPPDVGDVVTTYSITVTAPETTRVAAMPRQIAAWRLYRSTVSSVYDDQSLVAEVVANPEDPLPTTHVDEGGLLLAGAPPLLNRSMRPSRPVPFPVVATPDDLPDVANYRDGAPMLVKTPLSLYFVVDGAWAEFSSGGGAAPLTSPDGSSWRLVVDDTGALSTTRLTDPSAPPADGKRIVTALPLTGNSGTLVVDSTGNGFEDAPANRAHPVWFTVKPAQSCVASFDLNGTGGVNYDSYLTVYEGPDGATSYDQLTSVAFDDDSGDNSLSAISAVVLNGGQRYYVLASDLGVSTGSATLTLNWSGFDHPAPNPPTNVTAVFVGNDLQVNFEEPAGEVPQRYEAFVFKDGVGDYTFASTPASPGQNSMLLTGTVPATQGSSYQARVSAVYLVNSRYLYINSELSAPVSPSSAPPPSAPPPYEGVASILGGDNLTILGANGYNAAMPLTVSVPLLVRTIKVQEAVVGRLADGDYEIGIATDTTSPNNITWLSGHTVPGTADENGWRGVTLADSVRLEADTLYQLVLRGTSGTGAANLAAPSTPPTSGGDVYVGNDDGSLRFSASGAGTWRTTWGVHFLVTFNEG